MKTMWRDMAWAALLALAGLFIAAVDPVDAALGTAAIPTVAAPLPLDPSAAVTTWEPAKALPLNWDVQNGRAASEPATARIATDGRMIFVRFDVPQHEPLLAVQRANDAGDGTDDEIWVDLWPSGANGFYYQFAANANGTHWAYSSENTGYSPSWNSYGVRHGNDYTVTLEIPLHVLRGTGAGGWKAQFVRVVRSTGQRQVWSYGTAQTNSDDVNYAGPITGITGTLASKPAPRVALYGLGGAGSPGSGLSTSRMGADVSVPITQTSSIYATIHPDFSNVEIDQQTISPTAYQRQYTEVRPFFTQAANFYNNFNCDACLGVQELYTPNIPTPRDGYGFEGKQGPISFAAFDAVGDNRDDAATAFGFTTPDQHWHLTAQDVVATRPGIVDRTGTTSLSWSDNAHLSAYATYGNDSGTLVTNGTQAERWDAGAYYQTTSFGSAFSMRKIGADYDPLDGYVQHDDVAGYAAFDNKIFLFAPNDVFNSIQVGGFLDRYHGEFGGLNQTDDSAWVDVLTHSRIDANLNIGSSYLRLPDGIFTPVTQQGVAFTWHSGSYNSPGSNEYHGSSSTPTTFSYNTGRFGPGRVDSFVRSSTMTAGPRGTVSLEADDTRDYLDPGYGPTQVQWLERLGYTYTPSATSSFALGVRRIIGTAPIVDFTVLPVYTNAYNLSFAYHKRWTHDELYVAYGDASQLSTLPQFVVKLIHYFGAQKGT